MSKVSKTAASKAAASKAAASKAVASKAAASKAAASKAAASKAAASKAAASKTPSHPTSTAAGNTPRVVLPKVFIGSSAEGLDVAQAIQANLDHELDCAIWSQGVFGLSSGTLETLVRAGHQFDFAILVLTADDLAVKRGRTHQVPRDNVLFELGFFMGALGQKRTFIVHPRDPQLALPSDLAGITPATFDIGRENLRAALGAACLQIRLAVREELHRHPS